MKIIRSLSAFLVIIYIMNATQSNAQNQSILLPISGIHSTGGADYEGCKAINFSNTGNPVFASLPKHPFTAWGLLGEPHNEQHLANPSISMDNYYLGQHPAYAQAIVHDKDGNLLFFIVDNNIYNRNGESLIITPACNCGKVTPQLFCLIPRTDASDAKSDAA